MCVELGDRLAKHAIAHGTVAPERGDLISALTNLGFPEKDVLLVLKQIPAKQSSFAEQLRAALAMLDKA